MKLVLVNIYPRSTMARFMLSGYVLKAYLEKYDLKGGLQIEVLNFSETAAAELICEKLAAAKADVIGWSSYIWNIEKILDAVRKLRAPDKTPVIPASATKRWTDPSSGGKAGIQGIDSRFKHSGMTLLLGALRILSGTSKATPSPHPLPTVKGGEDKGEGEGGAVHIFGGPEISAQRILSLPDPAVADYYVIGEGETQMLALVRYLRAKKDGLNPPLPPCIARWEEGSLKYVPGCAEVIHDLDEIPSIYLDRAIEENLYEKQQVFTETQRGCRYKCKYCVYHRLAASIRYYSKERVRQELDYLILEKKVTAIRIIDAIFTSDLPRAKEIVRHLGAIKEKNGGKLPWIYWEFDYLSVDDEFLALTASLRSREKILNTDELQSLDRPQLYSDMMKDYTVVNSIGVESLCGDALKAVGRRLVNFEKFDAFLGSVNRHNIVLKMDLILGLPFETVESYLAGLELLLPYFRKTDHVLNIHRLQILPGSELEALTEKYGIVYSRSAPHMVSRTNTLSPGEFALATKLTTVLARAVNSPLRSLFFEAWDRSGKTLGFLLRDLYGRIEASGAYAAIPLIKAAEVDDIYWNEQVYRDLPSKFVAEILNSY